MTGLEKIIKAIESEAKANSDKIIAEAMEESEKILAYAKSEAQAKSEEIAKKPASEVKAILNRAQSGARLIKRQTILNAKQKMINEIIDKAKNKLTSLPDTEYFELILQIVKKHAHPNKGTIMFSKADLERLPRGFEESLKETIKDIKDASLTISDKYAAKLDSGFILIYGEIEENCTFDALFNGAKEELQDEVNAFLFQ
ncbi:MAG: hypothetical protein GX321_10180 [Clostridiales bacterium]|nr:hypothetical protein [Clostridiales bacterium]